MEHIDTATSLPRGKAGRPRNRDIDGRVLEQARILVREYGYPAVTMSMIAQAAGVGRQSLYRRWPGKAQVILAAFRDSASQGDPPVYVGLEETLSALLTGLFAHLDADGGAIRSLIASAQGDPQFLDQFRACFALPRFEAMLVILQEAVQRGALPGDADVALIGEMIHGAFWYRLLLGEVLDASHARRLAAGVAAMA